jgi:hypothetical protein
MFMALIDQTHVLIHMGEMIYMDKFMSNIFTRWMKITIWRNRIHVRRLPSPTHIIVLVVEAYRPISFPLTNLPPSPLQTYFLTYKLTFKRNYLQHFHVIFHPHYLISGKMAQPHKCLKLWNLFMAMSSQFVSSKQVTYVLLNLHSQSYDGMARMKLLRPKVFLMGTYGYDKL